MTLHMVRTVLDTARVYELGRRQRLPMRDVDLGYVVHAQLAALFGELAPAPFHVEMPHGEVGRQLVVLGYSPHPADALREHARTFATPESWAALRDDALVSKPMPERFVRGARLGFEARVCPTVRTRREGDAERPRDARDRVRSREIDAWLARCLAEGPGVEVDRAAVYRDWVAKELERAGAARLEDYALRAFTRERVSRRVQRGEGEGARRSTLLERPAALVRGVLRVEEPDAFAALLARGLGRHRSFGFGMLLLRPA